MDAIEYYKTLEDESPELEFLNQLLSHKSGDISRIILANENLISKHIRVNNFKRLFKKIISHTLKCDAYTFDNEEFLSPKEALDMIEVCIYQELLFEELKKGSGKRGFFISDFKSVRHSFVYFCFEFLLLKASGIKLIHLVALSKGRNYENFNIIFTWSLEKRVEVYVKLSRTLRYGVFEDDSFVGFLNRKRIG